MAQDTFTEGSDTNLTSHTPEAGGTWSVGLGTWTVNATTDRVGMDGTGGEHAWLSSDESSADCYTEVTGAVGVDTGSYSFGALARHTGFAKNNASCNNYRARLVGGASFELWKEVAGSSTQLGSSYTVPSFGATTDYAVQVYCSGTSISGILDGTTRIGPITDSAISAAGKPGIYFREAGSSVTTITLLSSAVLGGGGGSSSTIAWLTA